MFPRYADPDDSPPEVAAGVYRTPAWFSMPFAFETTRMFRGTGATDETGELFGLGLGDGRYPDKALVFFSVDSRISAERAASMLRTTPDYDIGPDAPAEVAGYPGIQFEMQPQLDTDTRIPAIARLIGHLVLSEENDWLVFAGARIRCTVLDLDGRALLIYIEAPRDEFDSFVAEAEAVLSTVVFLTAG